MRKFLLLLVALGFGFFVLPVLAEDANKEAAKTITIKGILVDSNCYLKMGDAGDDHMGIKRCGQACLNDNIPASVLIDKKLYVLIFSGHVFADCVGKTVEVTGVLHSDNFLTPEKVFVVEKDFKKAIKLRGGTGM